MKVVCRSLVYATFTP
ncbi:hypothetical protein M2H04_20960 [Vibrio vulnificus]|nr:hypothetical protein [Vibrio vulnificus]